ncbi:hypothetical protein GCM10011487_38570 [Steroidobacter agaridevorans]|uniref:SGNH hydrolase-type esterase domain-containing protein n=1 Tax=Steroidobacter agaridevorans TaxID=2695856 RepID=A0A829YEW9_9GAMM|nr:hypothetical protein [Steroidobacter agaridevorans]GFE81857.1 hypothetical protein GCM10011487_38570 [Steroidobacter agaridevorans]
MSASMLAGARWKRLVILGDSDMSWTDRISAALAAAQPEFEAFNLARRNLLAAEVRITQLTPALELKPDLAIVVAGSSDIARGEFNPALVRSELSVMISALRAAGADVLTLAWPERHRELAALTAEVTKKFGGICCASSSDAADPAAEVLRALAAFLR